MWCGRIAEKDYAARRNWVKKSYAKTLEKLAGRYSEDQAEYFIRAQFNFDPGHGFAMKGPLNFTHLVGEKKHEIYDLYLKTRDEYTANRERTISKIYEAWLSRQNNSDKVEVVSSTADPVAQYLVCVKKYRERIPVYDDVVGLMVRTARECIYWPGLRQLSYFSEPHSCFEVLFTKIQGYKDEIYNQKQ